MEGEGGEFRPNNSESFSHMPFKWGGSPIRRVLRLMSCRKDLWEGRRPIVPRTGVRERWVAITELR